MNNTIQISVKKRLEKAKEIQIEECYRQRNEQILEQQKDHTFSYLSWIEAWKCGWLRAHGLSLYTYPPSPFTHRKKLFKYSNEPYFKKWREEIGENHKKYKERK